MSYLAFPVSINGKTQSPQGKPFHMTLKFFGDTNISALQIQERLKGLDLTPVNAKDRPIWTMGRWEKAGFHFNVLELSNPPKRLSLARDAFNEVRAEDFPIYRPHITIPDQWAHHLAYLGPGNVLLELSPLALMGLT